MLSKKQISFLQPFTHLAHNLFIERFSGLDYTFDIESLQDGWKLNINIKSPCEEIGNLRMYVTAYSERPDYDTIYQAEGSEIVNAMNKVKDERENNFESGADGGIFVSIGKFGHHSHFDHFNLSGSAIDDITYALDYIDDIIQEKIGFWQSLYVDGDSGKIIETDWGGSCDVQEVSDKNYLLKRYNPNYIPYNYRGGKNDNEYKNIVFEIKRFTFSRFLDSIIIPHNPEK